MVYDGCAGARWSATEHERAHTRSVALPRRVADTVPPSGCFGRGGGEGGTTTFRGAVENLRAEEDGGSEYTKKALAEAQTAWWAGASETLHIVQVRTLFWGSARPLSPYYAAPQLKRELRMAVKPLLRRSATEKSPILPPAVRAPLSSNGSVSRGVCSGSLLRPWVLEDCGEFKENCGEFKGKCGEFKGSCGEFKENCGWAAHWPRKENGVLRTFWQFFPREGSNRPPPGKSLWAEPLKGPETHAEPGPAHT
eukprot:193044-Prorocentrum_minimum.AAC.1